ncbi:hypothetical protein ACIBO2_28400 [Nonomuraea sp. NPDC050022]|jgi:hypothetical protein|uniref:hypothetical protein n=1 Tax=unclassified Nonomuraea TaxID=2593643 RepID=UPI0033C305DB
MTAPPAGEAGGYWAHCDLDFWSPANNHEPWLGRGNQNVFEDSVAPVHEAGLTHLWDGSYRIDRNLRLDLAPGHTPGRPC